MVSGFHVILRSGLSKFEVGYFFEGKEPHGYPAGSETNQQAKKRHVHFGFSDQRLCSPTQDCVEYSAEICCRNAEVGYVSRRVCFRNWEPF